MYVYEQWSPIQENTSKAYNLASNALVGAYASLCKNGYNVALLKYKILSKLTHIDIIFRGIFSYYLSLLLLLLFNYYHAFQKAV